MLRILGNDIFFQCKHKILQLSMRNCSFKDKGKAEENVFFLKQERKFLERLKQSLDQRQRNLEQSLKENSEKMSKLADNEKTNETTGQTDGNEKKN